MAEVETPSQPGNAGSEAVAAFNQLAAETPIEDVAVAAPEEPTAPSEPSTPATLIIPLNKVPEKFRSKPEAIVEAYENAEKQMHAATQERAQLRREMDELRARLAAADQVTRMTTPQSPELNHWQKAGINPGEDIIVSPDKVGDHLLSEAERRAQAVATRAAQEAANQVRAEMQQQQSAAALITAFETAKKSLRDSGYTLSDEDWKRDLGYIAPAVARENEQNPGAVFDHNRYVEHFRVLKGAPAKATLPTEGAPPVAARSATVQNAPPVPTLNREDQQLQKAIHGALGKWLS